MSHRPHSLYTIISGPLGYYNLRHADVPVSVWLGVPTGRDAV